MSAINHQGELFLLQIITGKNLFYSHATIHAEVPRKKNAPGEQNPPSRQQTSFSPPVITNVFENVFAIL